MSCVRAGAYELALIIAGFVLLAVGLYFHVGVIVSFAVLSFLSILPLEAWRGTETNPYDDSHRKNKSTNRSA